MPTPDHLLPQFPIFIVSKGRSHSRLTMKALDEMGVPYRVIIEEDDYADYSAVIDPSRLMILPQKYKDEYDTFWPRERVQGKTGPGPARNYAWDVSVSEGYSHHWVMDDNLDAFHRLNRNIKAETRTGAIFKAMEDFTLRYDNIAISGPNYYSFCKTTDAVPVYVANTRIYSCLLIRNDIPYRWRGTYNEDTDLSLRVLKDGWTTLQFNAFLQGKVTTQRMSGGNTEEFYAGEGTYNKSQMLVDMHPDSTKLVWKFGRWHHNVNYKQFKQTLKFKKGFVPEDGINNYGMKLRRVPKPPRGSRAA